MGLRIYNTLGREVVDFVPHERGRVRLYVCGMTVYDYCHLGHARSMIAFDVVQRWLKCSGYEVNYVRNITDIDDKIIKRAVENNESIRALTNRMIDALHEDSQALGIEAPSSEPRATDYIPQMLSMIETLSDRGLAYQTKSGDVNFAVRKFKGYGRLSGKSLDELHAGERVAVLDGKEDPLDFVLWKSAKPEEPEEVKWASRYGAGRPGWHIECSAMSLAKLGLPLDIHAGGADLQFPHHENEIAQSEGASPAYTAHGEDAPDSAQQPLLAKVWMHNGFINVDNEKMSKSLGNFFTIRDILKLYDAETIRFFVVRAHYRSPLNYSNVHLDDAKGALKRLYTALSLVELPLGEGHPAQVQGAPEASLDWNHPYAARFKIAMDEDFSTPEAVSILFELASEVNRSKDVRLAKLLKQLGAVLGLLQRNPVEFLQSDQGGQSGLGERGETLSPQDIECLIEERALAKKNKDFAAADKIRKMLSDHNIVLKDSASGTQWERG